MALRGRFLSRDGCDFGGKCGLAWLSVGGIRNRRGESFLSGDMVRFGDGLRLGNNRPASGLIVEGDGILESLVGLLPALEPAYLVADFVLVTTFVFEVCFAVVVSFRCENFCGVDSGDNERLRSSCCWFGSFAATILSFLDFISTEPEFVAVRGIKFLS